MVYSGYYYMLTLLFIGAGVYSLTTTGWLNSLRLCFSELRPPSLTTDNDNEDAVEEPTETTPLIQDTGRPIKTLTKSAAI